MVGTAERSESKGWGGSMRGRVQGGARETSGTN